MTYRQTVAGVAAVASFLAPPSSGSAQTEVATQTSIAVRMCGATNVNSEEADVPESKQFDYFMTIRTNYPHGERVLCGDGKTWGAVHIEVKHKVANWDVAEECMTNTTSRGRFEREGGTRKWLFEWSSGHSALLVAGANGVLTAYPWDSGSEQSWDECGLQ